MPAVGFKAQFGASSQCKLVSRRTVRETSMAAGGIPRRIFLKQFGTASGALAVRSGTMAGSAVAAEVPTAPAPATAPPIGYQCPSPDDSSLVEACAPCALTM